MVFKLIIRLRRLWDASMIMMSLYRNLVPNIRPTLSELCGAARATRCARPSPSTRAVQAARRTKQMWYTRGEAAASAHLQFINYLRTLTITSMINICAAVEFRRRIYNTHNAMRARRWPSPHHRLTLKYSP